MDNKISKDEILKKICIALQYKSIGWFLGSGFSKAVMLNDGIDCPKWDQLLILVCKEFSIDPQVFADDLKNGMTYPLIATDIIKSKNYDEKDYNRLLIIIGTFVVPAST